MPGWCRVEDDVVVGGNQGRIGQQGSKFVEGSNLRRAGSGKLLLNAPHHGIRKLSAYRPEWTVRRGIEELLDAYTAGGLSIDDWNGDRYYRLRTIKTLLAAGVIDDELRFVAPPVPGGASGAR